MYSVIKAAYLNLIKLCAKMHFFCFKFELTVFASFIEDVTKHETCL